MDEQSPGTRPAATAMPGSEAGASVPRSLEGVLSALRQLAVVALDAGHPLAAAQIATTADRVEADAWPNRPSRPSYPARPRG